MLSKLALNMESLGKLIPLVLQFLQVAHGSGRCRPVDLLDPGPRSAERHRAPSDASTSEAIDGVGGCSSRPYRRRAPRSIRRVSAAFPAGNNASGAKTGWPAGPAAPQRKEPAGRRIRDRSRRPNKEATTP
jgi:hypothetical protein